MGSLVANFEASRRELAASLNEPVAIVGIGCRFPGDVSGPSSLWELLSDPRDIAKPVPASRFSEAGFTHPDASHHGTTNNRKAYWLEQDHKVFDAAFFNISPKEAEAMDPQVGRDQVPVPNFAETTFPIMSGALSNELGSIEFC